MKKFLYLLFFFLLNFPYAVQASDIYIQNGDDAALTDAYSQSQEKVVLNKEQDPKFLYYDGQKFKVTNRMKKDAAKIYKGIVDASKNNKKFTHTYKNEDIGYWNKVYTYVDFKYFPFAYGLPYHLSSASSGDFETDYISGKKAKAFLKKYRKEEKEIKKILQEIITSCNITEDTTKYDALCLFNGYMAENFIYEEVNHTAKYGMLKNRKGVCSDWAQVFYLLCRSTGIPCSILTDLSISHDYNSVIMDGRTYYIDATWDAVINGWFMLGKQDILKQDRNPDNATVKEGYVYERTDTDD